MLCTLGDENFDGFEEKSICDEELAFIKMLRDPKHVRLFNWVDLKCLDTRDLVDCPRLNFTVLGFSMTKLKEHSREICYKKSQPTQ